MAILDGRSCRPPRATLAAIDLRSSIASSPNWPAGLRMNIHVVDAKSLYDAKSARWITHLGERPGNPADNVRQRVPLGPDSVPVSGRPRTD